MNVAVGLQCTLIDSHDGIISPSFAKLIEPSTERWCKIGAILVQIKPITIQKACNKDNNRHRGGGKRKNEKIHGRREQK